MMILPLLLSWTLFICVGAKQWNFLVIIVDDLRTSIGCYGDRNAYTPNIDKFSGDAVIFSQAFAQQALCAPSRNSLLTSRRPDTLGLYDFSSYWREVAGNFTTLPQHLKNHGYRTKSIGKIFHPGISSNRSDDSPYSWTDKPFHPYTNRFKDARVCGSSLGTDEPLGRNVLCPVKVSQMPNQTLPDLENVLEARRFLHQLSRRRRRSSQDSGHFFLAIVEAKSEIGGAHKIYCSTEYHPLSKFEVPEPYEWPANVSTVAYNPWIDLRKRDDVKALNLQFPWEKIPGNFARRIIQSYYAAVSYIDDLVGQVLRELAASSFRDDTVILLTSDHGWSLGEHAVWAKYSDFQVAVKVPFLLSIPGITFNNSKSKAKPIQDINDEDRRIRSGRNGITVDSIVELLDIFPTIADLAGIPIPSCSCSSNCTELGGNASPRNEGSLSWNLCTEGVSLLPLVEAAAQSKKIQWKKAAFWQYPRPGLYPTIVPNSDEPRLRDIVLMGYSIRTENYRYTAWLEFSAASKTPDWRKIIAEELYHVSSDPRELRNVAEYEKFAVEKEGLREMLRRNSGGGGIHSPVNARKQNRTPTY